MREIKRDREREITIYRGNTITFEHECICEFMYIVHIYKLIAI